MVGDFLRAWTQATTAVSDLISTRFYPGVAPEGATYPLAVWNRVSDVPVNSLCGRLPYNIPSIQIDVYSESTTECEDVAREFYALAGYQGTLGGVNVRSVVLTNVSNIMDEVDEGDDEVLPRITLEFTIQHEE